MAELISSFELKEDLKNPDAECECELIYKTNPLGEYNSISTPKILPKDSDTMLHTYAHYVTDISNQDAGKEILKANIEQVIRGRCHLFNYKPLIKILDNINSQIDKLHF